MVVHILVKCAICLTKIKVRFLLFEHVMQSPSSRMHDFFTLGIECLFVNGLLECLKRPIAVHHTCLASVWVPEQTIGRRCRGQCCIELQSLVKSVAHSNSVKRVASSSIRYMLWFTKSEGPENDTNEVRTYQLSAHQRLRLKVRT